jgi:hypothetical protein
MPTFRKNVLSQYLRSKCDRQLRLSLYSPPELPTSPVRAAAGLRFKIVFFQVTVFGRGARE